MEPGLTLLAPEDWDDYELIDSGDGARLERFGRYRFVRPEHQAIWKPALDKVDWQKADAIFQATNEESGGHWESRRVLAPVWEMQYKGLHFWARFSNSRHLGVFPEQAVHWDWIDRLIRSVNREVKVLNLFGYTGLATLAAARAGARVTHVDASKKSVAWARENQELARLTDRQVRWIIDDALKFVQREARRGQVYDGLILDPPKFGRGPKGEVWEVFEKLPELLGECRKVLGDRPQFVVITAYAIRASALSLYYAAQEMMAGVGGFCTAGELVLKEQSANRILSTAIYVRWSAKQNESVSGDEP